MSVRHDWSLKDTRKGSFWCLRSVSEWRCPKCDRRVQVNSFAPDETYHHHSLRTVVEDKAWLVIQEAISSGCPCSGVLAPSDP